MFYKKTPVFDTNSEEPDQTPRSAASDLGLKFANVPFMER